MSEYSFENGQLTIVDEEERVDCRGPFSPVDLPDNLEVQDSLPEGYRLHLRLDANQNMQEAWLEKEGKREGQCRTYYSNGKVMGECYYLCGELHGPARYFGENRALLSESWFFEGKQLGKATQKYCSGHSYAALRYSEGEPTGVQEYYYSDGSLRSSLPYKEGRLHGSVVLCREGGHPIREITYAKGERCGVERQWNQTGTLVVECEYEGQTLVGTSRRWHENGRQAEEVTYYAPGKSDVRQWNCEGALLREAYYDEQDRYYHKVYDTDGKLLQDQRGYWNGEKLCAGDPG